MDHPSNTQRERILVIGENAILSWSGGKDSALALYEILQNSEYEILGLLTTVTKDYDGVSIHGVRRVLVERQAEALELPLEKVMLSKTASMEEYEIEMRAVNNIYLKNGVSSIVFGDLFLEDVRKYREDNLSLIGLKAIFPLWKRDTTEIANKFIELGFKAVVTCVDSKILDKKFVGKMFTKQFLSELPSDVDPCGENGEFHSFVFDGPIFNERIPFIKGKVVLRENRFFYSDLIPV